MKNLIILIFVALLFTSCIPTKNLTYFQDGPKELSSIQQTLTTEYKLQVNDILSIKIKAIDEKLVSLFNSEKSTNTSSVNTQGLYFNSYSVDKNGLIRIPYLGEINVLGYTEKEVRLKIETELAKMFKNMNELFVTVKLAGIKYTVLGEVGATGTNILFQNQVNILEVLANAGDVKITGNRKDILIVRNSIEGVKEIHLDLTNYKFMNNDGYYIQPNDVIYVKPLKQKTWGTGETGTKTMTTIITALSLFTTTFLLINRL
jgi:polysaccharide export outer membrane protein